MKNHIIEEYAKEIEEDIRSIIDDKVQECLEDYASLVYEKQVRNLDPEEQDALYHAIYDTVVAKLR